MSFLNTRQIEPSISAWIGSIQVAKAFYQSPGLFLICLQYSLVFLPSLVIGRLFDLGYFRAIFITSSSIIVVATFLIPQCHSYWQFLLVQGFLVGVSYIDYEGRPVKPNII